MERISYVGFSSNATTHLAMAEMMTMTRIQDDDGQRRDGDLTLTFALYLVPSKDLQMNRVFRFQIMLLVPIWQDPMCHTLDQYVPPRTFPFRVCIFYVFRPFTT